VKRTARKKAYVQIYRGAGNSCNEFFLNGTVYTSIDEPLRLAHKKMAGISMGMRVYVSEKYGKGVMLATYRTSDLWKPCSEKLYFDEAWPIFESYVRML